LEQKLQEEMLKLVHPKKEGKGFRKTCCRFVRYCYGKHCSDIHKKNVNLVNLLHTDFQENVGMKKLIENGNV